MVDYTKGKTEEVSLVRGELPSKRERGRKDDKSGIRDTDEPLASVHIGNPRTFLSGVVERLLNWHRVQRKIAADYTREEISRSSSYAVNFRPSMGAVVGPNSAVIVDVDVLLPLTNASLETPWLLNERHSFIQGIQQSAERRRGKLRERGRFAGSPCTQLRVSSERGDVVLLY